VPIFFNQEEKTMTKLEWKEYVQAAVNEAAEKFGNINILAARIKNVGKTTLYNWRRGRTVPNVDTFLKAFPEYNQEELEKYCANDEDATFEFATKNYSDVFSKCTNCAHHKVCKYSEDFYKLEERLNEEFSIIKTGMIIAHARIDCDEFEEAVLG
jgi:hypothetical protein